MNIPTHLFHIEKEHLGEDKLFPFHLFVYNPQSESYSAFLPANSPLDDNKNAFIDFIEEKGGELAIDRKQQKTFLNHTGLDKDDIPGLRERELSEFEKKRLEKIEKLEAQKAKDQENGEVKVYDLKNGLNECIAEDNFLPMIMEARKEIEIFSLNISHTVSLASYLAEELLVEDNFTNRVVAISYFLTKNMNMKNEETLADVVCAAFFCHLGYTQIIHDLSHKPELEMSAEEKKDIKKHPGYSHHLLLKSGIDLSDRCKNIIFQHHERYDGSGYPNQKHSEFIDILALVIGGVSHILEFSDGKITGSKLPIPLVINRLKNKTFTAGLESQFGDKIYDNLINLITTQVTENNEAA